MDLAPTVMDLLGCRVHEDELSGLTTGPQETPNMACRHPEPVQQGLERLAAWIQYRDRSYRQRGVSR